MNSRPAAVMVLHELATDTLILTQRSFHLRAHPGEICFPGGRWEPQDANLYATALRELAEELSISAERILQPKPLIAQPTLTGYVIHPWFATIEQLMPYKLAIDEVIALVQVAMKDVRQPTNYQPLTVYRNGWAVKTCQFIHSNNTPLIWGATAHIMKQLSHQTGHTDETLSP